MSEINTQIIRIDRRRIDDSDILPVAEAILSGKIVVFPTETMRPDRNKSSEGGSK